MIMWACRKNKKTIEVFYKENWIPLKILFLDTLEEEKDLCAFIGRFFSFMPNPPGPSPALETEVVEFFLRPIDSEEVTFYPGTFNPWHRGHEACLKLCPEKNIITVPDLNPWKESDEIISPLEKMKLLFKELERTVYSLYPGFLSLEGSNPTVEWFPRVKVKKKNLIIGADSFLSLHNWLKIEELVPHIHKLYVVPRGERESDLEKQRDRFIGLKTIFLEKHPYENLSSTEIRNKKRPMKEGLFFQNNLDFYT